MTSLKSTIQKEEEASKHYRLERDGRGLLLISEDNVARVEAMIFENSTYNQGKEEFLLDKEKIAAYKNSSAYILKQLKELALERPKEKPDYELMESAVRAINRENSTRMSITEIELVAGRICNRTNREMMGLLKHPCDNDYELVEIIRERIDWLNANGKPLHRSNYSFATKFCHYACLCFFEGKPEADNFSIYDGVVGSTLRKYGEKFGIEVVEDRLLDYRYYIGTIDSIIAAATKDTGEHISRNGFDHLLWYANK